MSDFPLHYSEMDEEKIWDAFTRNDVAEVERLMWNGADPCLADSNGVSLLHCAVSHLQFNMIYLLVRYGANPFAQDAEGETPYSRLLYKMREYDDEEYTNQNMELINLAQVKSLFISNLC